MLRCKSHKLSKRLSIQLVGVHMSSHEIELSCTLIHISSHMDVVVIQPWSKWHAIHFHVHAIAEGSWGRRLLMGN